MVKNSNLALLGLGGLGIYLLTRRNPPVSSGSAGGVAGGFGELGGLFGGLGFGAGQTLGALSQFPLNTLTGAGNFASGIGNAGLGIGQGLGSAFMGGGSLFEGLGSVTTPLSRTAGTLFTEVGGTLRNTTGFFENRFNQAERVGGNIFSGIGSFFGSVPGVIQTFNPFSALNRFIGTRNPVTGNVISTPDSTATQTNQSSQSDSNSGRSSGGGGGSSNALQELLRSLRSKKPGTIIPGGGICGVNVSCA